MERLRQTHAKEVESRDDEVEEIRQSCHKKVGPGPDPSLASQGHHGPRRGPATSLHPSTALLPGAGSLQLVPGPWVCPTLPAWPRHPRSCLRPCFGGAHTFPFLLHPLPPSPAVGTRASCQPRTWEPWCHVSRDAALAGLASWASCSTRPTLGPVITPQGVDGAHGILAGLGWG